MSTEQAQIELFPFLSQRATSVARPRYLLKDLTLSVENIIVLCIIFMMAVVVFFSFGVERGKQMVKKALLQTTVPAAIAVQPAALPEKVAERSAGPAADKPATSLKPVTAPLKTSERPSLERKGKETFTIQVASFKEKERAQQEAKRLKGNGHETFILPKGKHLIVCIGKFSLKDKAMEFSNKLKNRYSDCLVRRL